MLYGRRRELATLRQLLDGARAARGGALLVRGEAGVGKTAMLEAAAADATDMRVLRIRGAEAEADLAFGGLHALLRDHVDRIGRLPESQAAVLRGALGLGEQTHADRFLTGLAVLTMLGDLAEERPLLCVVDDVHWLDRSSADALLFAVRRLHAEPVAVLLAARAGHAPSFAASDLQQVHLGRLDQADAARLLTDTYTRMPPRARARVLAEAGGNPLALLELARDMAPDGTPRSHGWGDSAAEAVLDLFAERVAALPERTRTLLLIAATEGPGQTAVVLAAARQLGADATDAAPAEAAELVRFSTHRVEWRHPLAAAAVRRAATLAQRMAAHRALAAAVDPQLDADRRAWHRAAATIGPDEDVAADLVHTADRARARGGDSAVAAAYERAAEVGTIGEPRGRRTLAAAHAAVQAGQFDEAETLARRAADAWAAADVVAESASIEASVAEEGLRMSSAHSILDAAAQRVAPTDPGSAGRLWFRAVDAAIAAGDTRRVAASARQAAQAGLPAHARVFALARAAAGFAGDPGAVADALDALRSLVGQSEPTQEGAGRESPLLLSWLLLLGDDTAALAAGESQAHRQRQRGAAGILPWTLSGLARAQWNRGRVLDALASVQEGLTLARDTGQGLSRSYLAAIHGDLAAARGDTDTCTEVAAGADAGLARALAACSLNLLDLGQGRYEQALDRYDLVAGPEFRIFTHGALPDLVEAAYRQGEVRAGEDAAAWFYAWAEQAAQPWALGVAARCRALLEPDPDAAARRFTEAVSWHRASSGRPFERARTELLYGEWLRRHRTRGAARAPLRSAAELFGALGADPWTERARGELRAAGESSTSAPGEASAALRRLTPQELQVVRLAVAGLSNREIGARLFLSPRTAGYHLSNAYRKLGVASRRELQHVVPFEGPAGGTAEASDPLTPASSRRP